MPPAPTSADQADAFAVLLDHLGLDRIDTLGISAGTGAAVQLALRHPDRVAHLVIISGNWPGSPTATAPADWAKAFYSDRAMWMLKTLAPGMLGRLMGIPRGYPARERDLHRIERMLESIFPVGPRRQGAIFDAFTSNPEVETLALEELSVPTLIIHAVDDPLASHAAAATAAGRIARAHLVSLDAGGHLGLGQTERIRAEVSAFLAAPV
jgi:pimeloyl-ACP methyl ester carboxylesterase